MVGLLGFAEAREAGVVLPVDPGDFFPGVFHELLVDHAVEPGDVRVGLLKVDDSRFGIEPAADRKGLDPPVNRNNPAL